MPLNGVDDEKEKSGAPEGRSRPPPASDHDVGDDANSPAPGGSSIQPSPAERRTVERGVVGCVDSPDSSIRSLEAASRMSQEREAESDRKTTSQRRRTSSPVLSDGLRSDVSAALAAERDRRGSGRTRRGSPTAPGAVRVRRDGGRQNLFHRKDAEEKEGESERDSYDASSSSSCSCSSNHDNTETTTVRAEGDHICIDIPVAQHIVDDEVEAEECEEVGQRLVPDPVSVFVLPSSIKTFCHRHRHYLCLYTVLGAIIVVSLIAVAVVMSVQQGRRYSSFTRGNEGHSANEVEAKSFLELVLGSDSLDDVDSPYYRAFEWIVHDDPMLQQQKHQPNAGSTFFVMNSSPNFLQRYVAVYIYFATTQDGPWRTCNPQVASAANPPHNGDNNKSLSSSCVVAK